jgi:phosphoribosylamine--glycine ligase
MGACKVLVVGGGGREHSLCLALNDSVMVDRLYCAPGNAGTASFASNIDISPTDVDRVVDFCIKSNIDLVVVGPEAPLCESLADRLIAADIACFGPVAELAELEGSKLHAKQIMSEVGVPTAGFEILKNVENIDSALEDFSQNPWVIKRDVLAGGKGVLVTTDRSEAKSFITNAIQTDGKVLLEEFLPGQEASMLVVMDGSGFVCLPPSQDHKRAYDGDLGPNTGGMGAYCPAPIVTKSVHEKVISRIVRPMFEHLSKMTIPYRGVLYVGLMITDSGDPNVVEFNVRFGDPECQITLPLIKTDLFTILHSASTDNLSSLEVEFHDAHAITVVLASEGYPNQPIKGRVIEGISAKQANIALESAWVNHAGTKSVENKIIANGGRVLSCSAMSKTLSGAAILAYQLIETITLEGGHYRSDIGGQILSGNR